MLLLVVLLVVLSPAAAEDLARPEVTLSQDAYLHGIVTVDGTEYMLQAGRNIDGTVQNRNFTNQIANETEQSAFDCYVGLFDANNQDAPQAVYEAFWAQCQVTKLILSNGENTIVESLTDDADGYHKYFPVTFTGTYDGFCAFEVSAQSGGDPVYAYSHAHKVSLPVSTEDGYMIGIGDTTYRLSLCYYYDNGGYDSQFVAALSDADDSAEFACYVRLQNLTNWTEATPAVYKAFWEACTLSAKAELEDGSLLELTQLTEDTATGRKYFPMTVVGPQNTSVRLCVMLDGSEYTGTASNIYTAVPETVEIIDGQAEIKLSAADWRKLYRVNLNNNGEEVTISAGFNEGAYGGALNLATGLGLWINWDASEPGYANPITTTDGEIVLLVQNAGSADLTCTIEAISTKDRIILGESFGGSVTMNGETYRLFAGGYTGDGFNGQSLVEVILDETEKTELKYYVMLQNATTHQEAPQAVYDAFWDQCNVAVSLVYTGDTPQTGTAQVGPLTVEEGRLSRSAQITITGEFTGTFFMEAVRKDGKGDSAREGNTVNVGLATELTLTEDGTAAFSIEDVAYNENYFFCVDLGEDNQGALVTAQLDGTTHGLIRKNTYTYYWTRWVNSTSGYNYSVEITDRWAVFVVTVFDTGDVSGTISVQHNHSGVWLRGMDVDAEGWIYENTGRELYAASQERPHAGTSHFLRLYFGTTRENAQPQSGGTLTSSDPDVVFVDLGLTRDGTEYCYMAYHRPGTATVTYTMPDGTAYSYEWVVLDRYRGIYDRPAAEEAHHLQTIYWNTLQEDAQGKRWVWYLEQDGITASEMEQMQAIRAEDGSALETCWEYDEEAGIYRMKICLPDCEVEDQFSVWIKYDGRVRHSAVVQGCSGSAELAVQPTVTEDPEQPDTYTVSIQASRSLNGTKSCLVLAGGYDSSGRLRCIGMTDLLNPSGESTDGDTITLTSPEIVEIRVFTIDEKSLPLLEMMALPLP